MLGLVGMVAAASVRAACGHTAILTTFRHMNHVSVYHVFTNWT